MKSFHKFLYATVFFQFVLFGEVTSAKVTSSCPFDMLRFAKDHSLEVKPNPNSIRAAQRFLAGFGDERTQIFVVSTDSEFLNAAKQSSTNPTRLRSMGWPEQGAALFKVEGYADALKDVLAKNRVMYAGKTAPRELRTNAKSYQQSSHKSDKSDLVSEIKNLYANSDPSNYFDPNTLKGMPIKKDGLPQAALALYQRLLKRSGGDYEPAAYSLALPSKVRVIAIIQNTDGGSTIDFFNSKGQKIISGGQSESGEFHWSS